MTDDAGLLRQFVHQGDQAAVGTAVVIQQQFRTKIARLTEANINGDQPNPIAALKSENGRLRAEIHRLMLGQAATAATSAASEVNAGGSFAGSLNQLRILTDLQSKRRYLMRLRLAR